jgi:hypothetical protein
VGDGAVKTYNSKVTSSMRIPASRKTIAVVLSPVNTRSQTPVEWRLRWQISTKCRCQPGLPFAGCNLWHHCK